MSLYVIGDLHLPGKQSKPMDVFGEKWKDHPDAIFSKWIATEKDTVVIAGDFSWATDLNDAEEDFRKIGMLPGKKILLKGNHDYWWSTVRKMQTFSKGLGNFEFLHNNSFEYNNISICGTRGWMPEMETETEDRKILEHEYLRLENSLKSANSDRKIVFLHFPPDTTMITIMKRYGITDCYHGHIHGNLEENYPDRTESGIQIRLISADHLNFGLYKII